VPLDATEASLGRVGNTAPRVGDISMCLTALCRGRVGNAVLMVLAPLSHHHAHGGMLCDATDRVVGRCLRCPSFFFRQDLVFARISQPIWSGMDMLVGGVGIEFVIGVLGCCLPCLPGPATLCLGVVGDV
jgi:hypothetical protein